MRPSVSFTATASSSAVPAPGPAIVAESAATAGAEWFMVRPSTRSFSGWVGVCLFRAAASAGQFARDAARSLGLQFCLVRARGAWFAVSVPVFVAIVPASPAGSLPCEWFPLSGASPKAGNGLPAEVLAAIVSAPALGFSGSRSLVPDILPAIVGLVPTGVPVLVGCARGVDQVVRELRPDAIVFSVERLDRAGFAARSAAFIESLACRSGVLLSFPSGQCPIGLVPAAQWRSASGSGSWGSLALAVGLGVPVFVYLPEGQPPSWGFVALGAGWWAVLPSQLPLF